MKELLLKLGMCLLLVPSLIAQDSEAGFEDSDLRVEIDLQKRSEEFFVSSLGEDGLILFRPLDSTRIEQVNFAKTIIYRHWEFTKYTTDFIPIWSLELEVPSGMDYSRHYWDQKSLHILLVKEKPKHKRTFQVVSLNAETGETRVNYGMIPENFQINDFSVVRNLAYIGGETIMGKLEGYGRALAAALVVPIYFGVLQYKPQIIFSEMDLNSGKFKQFPLKYKGVSRVQSFAPNEWGRSMATIINYSRRKETSQIFIKEYAGDKLIRNLEVNPKSHNRLLSAKIIHLGRHEFLVVGTYAAAYYRQKFWKRVGALITGQRLPEMAQGIYVAKFKYRGQKFIKYFNFTEFENFFEAYGAKQEKKVKKKAKKKKKKGKELLLDFNLLLHDIIETENEYLLVAESYREVYSSSDPNDKSLSTLREKGKDQFAGYQYTHAIVAGFDKESGDMTWDNSFPIWNVVSQNLDEHVQVLAGEENDMATLVYNFDGMLQSRTISQGEVIEKRNIKALRNDFIRNSMNDDFESEIAYWYNNYFLAWGYQKVKKEDAGLLASFRKKPIFYFYKVSY